MALEDWATRVEVEDALDPIAAAIERRIPDALRSGPLHDGLAGNWLGHALHPTLTDVPIGTWTGATILDIVGPRRWQGASTLLTGLGLAAAVPTVAAGVVEWLDTSGAQRRVGVAHALANSTAALLYLTSFVSKLTGRHALGRAASISAAAFTGMGGFLGGHMSFARGVGMDHAPESAHGDPGSTDVSEDTGEIPH